MHLEAVRGKALRGVEFPVADLALEVLGPLVFDQGILIFKRSIAVKADDFHFVIPLLLFITAHSLRLSPQPASVSHARTSGSTASLVNYSQF